MGMTRNELTQLQSLPLDIKIAKTKLRLREWYTRFNGDVYVSFSGGKDSTVLLDIARSMYPEIPAVFCDTGLEYPEIREFVRSVPNVTWIKPKMSFKEVITKWGYPMISKEQSQYIYEARTSKSEYMRNLRINGNRWGQGKIFEKWVHLVKGDIPISHRCCVELKKKPFHRYERCGKHPIIGIMACESSHRVKEYLKTGCNAFDVLRPVSRPLGFWTEADILEYLKTYNSLGYASVYGDIVDGKTTGITRSGCMFCMYGIQFDEMPNRFQRMQVTHPKLWNYCINALGVGAALDAIGIEYGKSEEVPGV